MDIINPIYKDEEIIEELKNYFSEYGFVQINNFLIEDTIKLQKQINNQVDNKQEITEEKNLDPFLTILLETFKSNKITKLLEEITEFSLTPGKISCKNITKSTKNTYNKKNYDRIYIIYDLSKDPLKRINRLNITTPTETLISIPPAFNTLNLIYLPKEVYLENDLTINHSDNQKITRIEIEFTIIE